MMNKGLEMIEAAYLFDMPPEKLDVLVHPQSIIHSLVDYADGSTLAQLGPPDMRTPIACAFAWPDRLPWPAPGLDLAAVGQLTFEPPDLARFPAIGLARDALRMGGQAPSAMNAANEIAVGAFLDQRIGFLDIATIVSDTLSKMNGLGELATMTALDPLEEAFLTDTSGRRIAQGLVANIESRR